MTAEAFAKLSAPFRLTELEWRIQRSGKKNDKIWAMVLTYITAPAIMDRLDEVVGPMNWECQYQTGPDGGVICKLSIRDQDGKWISKEDGAENTDIEAVKGGLSSALKRAARCWGIGRYLYKLDASFAIIDENGKYRDKVKTSDGKEELFSWSPPSLPDWALHPDDKKKLPEKSPIQVLKERYIVLSRDLPQDIIESYKSQFLASKDDTQKIELLLMKMQVSKLLLGQPKDTIDMYTEKLAKASQKELADMIGELETVTLNFGGN